MFRQLGNSVQLATTSIKKKAASLPVELSKTISRREFPRPWQSLVACLADGRERIMNVLAVMMQVTYGLPQHEGVSTTTCVEGFFATATTGSIDMLRMRKRSIFNVSLHRRWRFRISGYTHCTRAGKISVAFLSPVACFLRPISF